MLHTISGANCFVVVPEGVSRITQDSSVEVVVWPIFGLLAREHLQFYAKKTERT